MFVLGTKIVKAESIYSAYVGMSDDLKGAIITALVTAIVSIIGFIITNVSMKKNFKNELERQRESITLEKMSTIPFEVLSLMDRMMKSDAGGIDDFKRTMNSIYSYGSEKAIAIVALMQKENYNAKNNAKKTDQFRVMAAYVLLATQIKMDVTGVCVNPEFWFNMRITDFEEQKSRIRDANNALVTELELDDRLYMH